MSDTQTPFDELADAAERYGDFSLENYARVRSVAEALSSGFCRYLGSGAKSRCCYLVPAQGEWAPADFRSGAFSVSGQRFLPLGPIQFGLAVRVSRTGDWMRLVLTAAKNGEAMDIHVERGETYTFTLPVEPDEMKAFFAHLHRHLVDWFEEQSRHYEHGEYGGGSGIGFDFLEAGTERDDAPGSDEIPPAAGEAGAAARAEARGKKSV